MENKKIELKKLIEDKMNLNGELQAYLDSCESIKSDLDKLTDEELRLERERIIRLIDERIS